MTPKLRTKRTGCALQPHALPFAFSTLERAPIREQVVGHCGHCRRPRKNAAHRNVFGARSAFMRMRISCLCKTNLPIFHSHFHVHGDRDVLKRNRGRCNTFRSRLGPSETIFGLKNDPSWTPKVTPGPPRNLRRRRKGPRRSHHRKSTTVVQK